MLLDDRSERSIEKTKEGQERQRIELIAWLLERYEARHKEKIVLPELCAIAILREQVVTFAEEVSERNVSG